MIRSLGLMVVAMLSLAGCMGGGSGGSETAEVASTFCKRQHIETSQEGEIAVCDELYPEAPAVRLPPSTADRAYAVSDGLRFVTREGTTYAMEDDAGEQARAAATAVYELTLFGPAVKDFRKVLTVPEAAFFTAFLGRTAEGTISARTEDGGYEMEPSLPVRVVFDAKPAETPSDPKTPYELVATLENLDSAVTASSGDCLPALSSHGDASTFAPAAKVELRATRAPSMHAPGDNTFVLAWRVDGEAAGSMMGREWFVGPTDLVKGSIELLSDYVGIGHAAPGSVPTLSLALVEGGGEACTP